MICDAMMGNGSDQTMAAVAMVVLVPASLSLSLPATHGGMGISVA